jgi:hypothetical protein
MAEVNCEGLFRELQHSLREARSLTAQARYDATLEKYLWLYRHAHEYNEAFPGVHFVLSAWVGLGEKYPPARDALLSVRNESIAAFENGQGSFKLFMDVSAINAYLHDDAQTVELFKLLHRTDPELARQCYAVTERNLVVKGEWAICNSYLTDLEGRLEAVRQSRHLTLEIAEKNEALDSPQESLKAFANCQFEDETSRLITILEGMGRLTDADRVREFVHGSEKSSPKIGDARWGGSAVAEQGAAADGGA